MAVGVIFLQKDSVFLVGGRGDKTGEALAAGCTKAWWDAHVAANGTGEAGTLSAVQTLTTVNGLCIIDETVCSYNNTTKRINLIDDGEFSAVEAGMVAYVSDGGGEITTGRYEITDVDPSGNWIEVNDIVAVNNSAGDVILKIGGSFDTLQNASDNTNAGTYNVDIYTCKDETPAAAIDIDTGGGSSTNGTFKNFEGYRTSPGDLNRGGTHYGAYVVLDANDSGDHILYIKTINHVFRNIYATDSAAKIAFLIQSASGDGIVECINCKASHCSYGFFVSGSNNYNPLFLNCIAHDNTSTGFTTDGRATTCWNCIGYDNAVNFRGEGDFASVFIGCLGIGSTGTADFYMIKGSNHVINCTSYDAAAYGIMVSGGNKASVYNTIVNGASTAALFNDNGSMHGDYNCVDNWINSVGYNAKENTTSVAGDNDIVEATPFRDAANDDFTLVPTSGCLNTGLPTPGSGYCSRGAWQRKSYLRYK